MHGKGWHKSCESYPSWAFAIPDNCCWHAKHPEPFRIQPYSSCQSELYQLSRDLEGKSSKPVPEGCIRFCDHCYFIACKKVQTHQNKAVLFIFLLMHSFAIQQHITTVIHAIIPTSRFKLFTFHPCMNNPDLDNTFLFDSKLVFPWNFPSYFYAGNEKSA